MRAIGYARVSSREQGDSGLGLESQEQALQNACELRGWSLTAIHRDVASGASTRGRTGLSEALAALQSGDVLIVAKLDRLARSLVDFAELVERSRLEGWSLVALDIGIDLTTPTGEMIAAVLAALAQWERRIIAQRTKDALAVHKQQGGKLGRPRAIAESVRERIRGERALGRSFRQIAAALDADGVPTGHGAPAWGPTSVRAAILD